MLFVLLIWNRNCSRNCCVNQKRACKKARGFKGKRGGGAERGGVDSTKEDDPRRARGARTGLVVGDLAQRTWHAGVPVLGPHGAAAALHAGRLTRAIRDPSAPACCAHAVGARLGVFPQNFEFKF